MPAVERMLEATARAEDRHFWFRGLRRHARRLLDDARPARPLRRIVDCGCGTGRNLDWLGAYGPATGVELHPAGLRHARSRGRRVVRASVAALPFADASADLATSFDVLYCLDDETEARALAEMWRVLVPGGLVLVNVAALDVLRGSHSVLTHEVRRYTRARLAARLVRAGFALERMTYTNLSPLPAAIAVRGVQRLTGRAAEPSDADLHVPSWPVNAAFDAALRAEAVWLRVANLPIGTSLMALGRKRESPGPAGAGGTGTER
jgi:SAM-dependent methyltransferase